MSYTTMLAAGPDGNLVACAEFRNAWRGAMSIWNHLARRYLGLEGFPLSEERGREAVWALAGDPKVEAAHRLALQTTLDGALLGPEMAEAVAVALETFPGATENLIGQAKAIREAFASGARAVAWHQMSVDDNPWESYNLDRDEGGWWIPAP